MDTIADIREINSWLEEGYFPKRGESCSAWGRPCDYLDNCHMDLSSFYLGEGELDKILEEEFAPGKYHITVTLEELMEAQLELNGGSI